MSRRRFPILLALCAAGIAAFLASCRSREPRTAETFVMGTKAWVTIADAGRGDAEEAARAAFREMHRIESVMSTWKPESELSRLNAESRGGPIAVSGELRSLVDSSIFYSRATAGAFDVTVRPLVLLWGFQGGEVRMPDGAEIDAALALVGYEKISLDAASSAVALPPGVQIDLAGIAKGYAVDRAAAVLEERGVRSALVNLGGNIRALGRAPGKRAWKIGVRDPRGGTGTVGTILLADGAVATSGNYENFVEIDGRRYGHLLDPRSGRPVSNVLGVTVVAPTALAADALSTGFFILGPEGARTAAESLPGVAALFASPVGDRISYETIGNFHGRLILEAPSDDRMEGNGSGGARDARDARRGRP